MDSQSSRSKPTNESGANRKIIIAVDFGTTYSGLAWAQTRRPKVHEIINLWPDKASQGLEGTSSDKVPTIIRYEGRTCRWGFQVDDEESRHEWFKLGLGLSQPQSMSNSSRKSSLHSPQSQPNDVHIEKLIVDYLTALRVHTEKYLKHKVGETALRSTPIKYIITTPAVWPDAAQAKTRTCAEKAGMGNGDDLQIVSEPEAAAVYALDAMDPHNIKVGETFVLCDAGGGTVDLISYTVKALKPLLEVAEASPGSGGLCGSTYLNRSFREFLTGKLRNNSGWEEDVMEEAMKRFEQVKKSFSGNPEDKITIPVPGLVNDAIQGVFKGKFTLRGTDLVQIFAPILQAILNLIQDQVESITFASGRATKVILVGGFGQSSYLRNHIRKELGSEIEVMVSPNSWTAVVRGALMKGLAEGAPLAVQRVQIQSRAARKHYGVESNVQFDGEEHDYDKRWWDPFDKTYKIEIMDWHIKKGSLTKEQEPTKFHYFIVQLVKDGPPKQIHCRIKACDDPYNGGAPMYQTSGVIILVEIIADLSRIPESRIKKERGKDRQMYYQVDYVIEMTIRSASINYELFYDGLSYGSVRAEYVGNAGN